MFKERSLARIFSTLSVICAVHHVNKEGNNTNFYLCIYRFDGTHSGSYRIEPYL